MPTISASLSGHGRHAVAGSTTQVLLLCGVGAAFFYVAGDLLGTIHWRGYHVATQSLGELSAIDAPSRTVVVPLRLVASLFSIACAFGIREVAGAGRTLRIAGNCALAVGLIELVSPFFPMHLRGLTPTTSDSVYVVLATIQAFLALVAISAAAMLRDNWLRFFCLAAVATIVIFGVVSAMQTPQIVANLPTPWLGITERIAVYAYLAWLVVLAVELVRAPRRSRY